MKHFFGLNPFIARKNCLNLKLNDYISNLINGISSNRTSRIANTDNF